jgi:hypothetical protein
MGKTQEGQMKVGCLWILLMVLSVQGWTADDDRAATPLALAYAAADAAESLTSRYHYALDYTSLAVQLTATVDPTAAAGTRLEITSSKLSEDAKPEQLDKVIADLERTAPNEYWCSAMMKGVPPDAELVGESEDLAVYRFNPAPTGNSNDGFMANLVGEISIDRKSGAVRSFNLSAPKPFRQALIAKIREFELTTRCESAPDGRTYASGFNMRISGSAAFRGFKDNVVRGLKIIQPADYREYPLTGN